MRRWDRLNERQLAVLQRIGTGDDLSGSDRIAERQSAGALANRGLVVVNRRGGGWRTEITEPGRFYLEHGHHPDDPAFAAAEPPSSKQSSPQADTTQGKKPKHGPPPASTRLIAVQRRAAVADLLEKLGKTEQLVLRELNPDDEANLRRVIDFAKRHNLAPEGKRIEKARMYDGSIRVKLVDEPHFNSKPVEARPVPVPQEVPRLHPLLASLSAPADVLGVSKDSLPRALRIMHALIGETERRGYEVGWAQDTSQGLEIRIDGHMQTVTMEEERATREVVPTPDELAATKTYSWQRISPQVRKLPSGKLAVSVGDEGLCRTRRRWADRKRWSVEDRLGEVLATVEAQAREKEERRRAEEERTRQRQLTWEQAMADAKTRFRRDRQATQLISQVEVWELASRIRRFCSAAERSGHADKDWLTWARAHADEIDPTNGRVSGPEEVVPGPEDLRAYLGRWSPYGPQSR
jgi:hypothetical protein